MPLWNLLGLLTSFRYLVQYVIMMFEWLYDLTVSASYVELFLGVEFLFRR